MSKESCGEWCHSVILSDIIYVLYCCVFALWVFYQFKRINIHLFAENTECSQKSIFFVKKSTLWVSWPRMWMEKCAETLILLRHLQKIDNEFLSPPPGRLHICESEVLLHFSGFSSVT